MDVISMIDFQISECTGRKRMGRGWFMWASDFERNNMGNAQVSPKDEHEHVSPIERPSMLHYARSASISHHGSLRDRGKLQEERLAGIKGTHVQPKKEKRLWLMMEAWVQTFLIKVGMIKCTSVFII